MKLFVQEIFDSIVIFFSSGFEAASGEEGRDRGGGDLVLTGLRIGALEPGRAGLERLPSGFLESGFSSRKWG